MRTAVVVPPASPPVTVEEARRHAGIDPDLVVDGLDAYIGHLVAAATAKLESMVDRALVSQTLETTYRGPVGDRWYSPEAGGPCDGSWRLPRADVVSIVSVGYLDRSGVSQVLDPTLYRAELGAPGRLLRPCGASWPAGDSLSVRYVAGYGGPEAVPDVAKLIVNMLVAAWYARREATSGTQVYDVPKSVDCLADALRWGSYP